MSLTNLLTQGWQPSVYKPTPAGVSIEFGTKAGSTALGNQVLRLAPFYVPNPLTLTKLGVEVGVVGDAGCTFIPAIYANDLATALPGNLVYQGAAVPGDATGQNLANANVTLPVGWYWVGAVVQGAAVTVPQASYVSSQFGDTPSGGGRRWGGAVANTFGVVAGVGAQLPANFQTAGGSISTNAATMLLGQT